jgi:hypothetical protein|tara:strand:- start:34 stop:369 length:336 start_codon:yes stop_codon:yes gene_type:complete
MPLTEKQMKIARVAEPRDKITGDDFAELRKNSKAGGGIMSFATGGEVDDRIVELEELLESPDEDVRDLVRSDLYKERDDVKMFSKGMSVNAPTMSRGCGAVLKGKKFSGTY